MTRASFLRAALQTFLLPCRKVFAHGQRKVEVVGPVREDEARKVHIGFWVKEEST